jgi:hypothetical protein
MKLTLCDGLELAHDALSTVCKTDCAVGHHAGVVSACGNYRIALAVDYAQGPYAVQCLKDPQTSTLCGPLIQSYNASGGLLALQTSELCNYCVLETPPCPYSVAIASLLSSAVSSCGP